MSGEDALGRFASRFHPEVLTEIRDWQAHPVMHTLHDRIRSQQDRGSFHDVMAEAMVAMTLRERGATIRCEDRSPGGLGCDFEIRDLGHPVYIHVKRLDTRGARSRRQLTITPRIRYLERIDRPFVVRVRWRSSAAASQLQRFVEEAAVFIRTGHVGDEHVVRDPDGLDIGGVLIEAPHDGTHVTLVIGPPTGFMDQTDRFQKRLRRAYRQFQPRAHNIILIASSETLDRADCESALFGSHVERWDTHPPKGRMVAHGRAEDGFWHGDHYRDSRIAGWFHLDPACRPEGFCMWYRDDASPRDAVRDRISFLLES